MSDTVKPTNPLSRFYRKPDVYVNLPSRGLYNTPDSIELTPDGQVAISSMTTQDELLLNIPDAMLNGESISKSIQSCAPGIHDVYSLTIPDVDIILAGIRIATYGENMEFTSQCPECATQNVFKANLRTLADETTYLEPSYHVEISTGLNIFIKPHTYASNVKKMKQSYEEGLILKSLVDDNMSEEQKLAVYNKSFKRVTDLAIELTADSVVKITDNKNSEINATRDQIKEFITNIPKKDADLIINKITELNDLGMKKVHSVTCGQCNHSWDTRISLDSSNFFV